MQIYIPTLHRPTRQITYGNLSKKLQKNTVLVISQEEVEAHAGFPTLVSPVQGMAGGSLGHVRQWIYENHDIAKYGPMIAMLDDDIQFYQRRTDETDKFEPCTVAALELAFTRCEKLLRTMPHGGLRHREMANVAPLVETCTRAMRVHFYDVRVLRKHQVKFTNHTMEDFDGILQLLRAGVPNFTYSGVVQNQQGGSNAPGGCSAYRDATYQSHMARRLVGLHPEFVKAVEKTTKTSWGGGTRLDVTVKWKKAFQSSGKELPCLLNLF